MSIMDMFEAVIIFLIFSISCLFGYMFLSSFQIATADILPEVAQNITAEGLTAMAGFDYGFILLFVGVMIAIVVGAFLIPTHPIFLVISIILFIIILVVVPQIANIFLAMTETEELADAASQYPMMISMWQQIGLLMLFFGIIIIIVIYSKSGGSKVHGEGY